MWDSKECRVPLLETFYSENWKIDQKQHNVLMPSKRRLRNNSRTVVLKMWFPASPGNFLDTKTCQFSHSIPDLLKQTGSGSQQSVLINLPTTELNSCDRDYMARKVWNIYHLTLYRYSYSDMANPCSKWYILKHIFLFIANFSNLQSSEKYREKLIHLWSSITTVNILSEGRF